MRQTDTLRAQAHELFTSGEQQQALALLHEARQAEPDNHQLTLDAAELTFKAGKRDEAVQLLDGLPCDIREEPEGVRLRALLNFAVSAPVNQSLAEREARVAAQPDDTDQRYQLGCAYVLQENYEAAIETFMTILAHDHLYQDDAGRKALLAVFNLLGDTDERVAGWRRRMFNALH